VKVKEVQEMLVHCDPGAEVILVLQHHGRVEMTLFGVCRRSDLAQLGVNVLPGDRLDDVLFIEGEPLRSNKPNGSPPSR
jgi:hypothetical protein